MNKSPALTQKRLTMSIIGKPNAGKSTLLNRLIKQKISIVTPKVQTTRSIITGIITTEEVQLVFFDTPGIFIPKKKLEKAMVRCAWSSLHSADIIGLIIDSETRIDETTINIIKRIITIHKEMVFLLNKTDIKSTYLEENSYFLKENYPEVPVFKISALQGEGIEYFFAFLKSRARLSHWLYEEDDITNLPMRFLATEITREQLFLKLHQELPYNLTVDSESWTDEADGSVTINQVIIVSKEAYKKIIIGKKGDRIKQISTSARLNIEELVGCRVHLFLFIKVRKNWEDDPDYLPRK